MIGFTEEQFFKKVKALRLAQKQYFKSKSYADLEHSKKLEREIDALIEKMSAMNGGQP